MWRYIFLLPSQHFRCEGLYYLFDTFRRFSLWRFRFLPRFGFFYLERVFYGWIFEFYLPSRCFVVKFHALSLGLTRSYVNSLVLRELKSIYIYICIYIYRERERDLGSRETKPFYIYIYRKDQMRTTSK